MAVWVYYRIFAVFCFTCETCEHCSIRNLDPWIILEDFFMKVNPFVKLCLQVFVFYTGIALILFITEHSRENFYVYFQRKHSMSSKALKTLKQIMTHIFFQLTKYWSYYLNTIHTHVVYLMSYSVYWIYILL